MRGSPLTLAIVSVFTSWIAYGQNELPPDPCKIQGEAQSVAATSQEAAAYTVLYTFGGGADGAFPYAGLVPDKEGNLYGTTAAGGDPSASCAFYSTCGVVFKLDPRGKETILYTFTGGADGGSYFYDSTLIRDEAGNLYGTTGAGGDLTTCGGIGCGVVFKVDPRGKETVLYTFTGGTDGGAGGYDATLVRDDTGNLYGTTFVGGDLSACGGIGCGVVFKVDPGGKETVLYAFTGGADGAEPYFGALILDKAGNLYGTTSIGGKFYSGVVFKVDPAGKETVLYTFTGGADGGQPIVGLTRDEEGNLYGTASAGGNMRSPYGDGVVFKLDPAGKETVLYTFTGGADGGLAYSPLVRGAAGNLYGTTFSGGDLTGTSCAPSGCGVVFKVDPAGKETVLYTFTGGADGGYPYAGLVLGKEGSLYGTTSSGGASGGCYGNGCGVVFKLTARADDGQ